MPGVRHSYHLEGNRGVSRAEQIAKQYITVTSSTQRGRMSQPISPTSGLEEPDPIIGSSCDTPRRKKKKSKDGGRRRNSRTRGKGDLVSDDIQENIGSPLVSPTSKDSPKKKKKGKKSENLGCMVIPDIDSKFLEKEIHTDESARFSAVTDPTQLLDEDDFTASTKDASTKDETKLIAYLAKTPKPLKKKERSKTPDKKQRTKTPDKKRSKSPNKKSKRSSLIRGLSKKGLDEKKNESWGRDPAGNKSYIAPDLLHLLVGPETKPPSHDSDLKGTMPLKKSHSIGSSLEGSTHLKKVNSYHSPHRSPTRKATLRSKNIEDPDILDTKNASWGETRGRRGPCSPAVKPYTSPYTIEKASPSLRRNVKSFGSAESWRNDPKRDRDIPSILFISNDAPEPSFNETWDSRQFYRPSSRMLGKDTITGEKPPSTRARSAGAASRRRRSSAVAPKVEKPPQPLRKKAPRRGSANATWEADPRRLGNGKVPLSPGLVDILGVNPAYATGTKSPGRFKNTMTTSTSLSSLKNNLKKLRGGRTNENRLRAVPML